MSKEECVLCGSVNVASIVIPEKINAPLGPEVTYNKKVLVCSDCSFENEFSEDEKVRAIAESKKKSAEEILDFLKSEGWSYSAIERALGLPQRTIHRWKSEHEPSAAGLALLRILRCYPFLLKLAEEKFSENTARDLILNEAVTLINKLIKTEFNHHLSSYGMYKYENSMSSNVIIQAQYSTLSNSNSEIKTVELTR